MNRFASGGFSLVEVLVAVAILGIGVMGTSYAVMTGLKAANSADQNAMARIFAEGIQERIWLYAEGDDEPECEDDPQIAGLEDWQDHPLLADGPLANVTVNIDESDDESLAEEFEFEDGELEEIDFEGDGCRLVIAPQEGNERFVRMTVTLNPPYGDDD